MAVLSWSTLTSLRVWPSYRNSLPFFSINLMIRSVTRHIQRDHEGFHAVVLSCHQRALEKATFVLTTMLRSSARSWRKKNLNQVELNDTKAQWGHNILALYPKLLRRILVWIETESRRDDPETLARRKSFRSHFHRLFSASDIGAAFSNTKSTLHLSSVEAVYRNAS